MNYILKPSLEYITLVKIAATLWNTHDIKDLIKKFNIPSHSRELRDEWSNIEDIVLGKVPQLPLPELLKEKALVFIRAIGCQILNWIIYHHDKLCFDISVPDEFHWTPRGGVDKKKTAEGLIRDEAIDVIVRYKLACFYCLEDDIRKLWEKIPADRKKDFYKGNHPTIAMRNNLVDLDVWTCRMKGELSDFGSLIVRLTSQCSGNRYAFEYAASIGNEVATEYFLQKLKPQDRKESLLKTLGIIAVSHHDEPYFKEYYSDIVCILLSQMNGEEQVELFKSHSYRVLNCFLYWPKQIFFIETASRMWNFLTVAAYDVLLKKIIDKIRDGCKDFNYQKLLREFWQQSPNDHKEYVFNKLTFCYLLKTLFEIRDKDNIQLIFRDASHTEKKRFLNSVWGEKVCRNLIDGEAWDLLKFFIQECLLTKEEVIKFKEDFRMMSDDIFCKDDFESRKMKLDKFLLLLNDLISGFSKRKCVEDDNCEAKRLCDN